MNPSHTLGADYLQIFENYKTHLATHGDLPFSSYCSLHNKPYRAIKSWLGVKGLSIKAARTISPPTIRSNQVKESITGNIHLIPLSIPSLNPAISQDPIRNLRITLTSGAILEIAELNIHSLKELIR